MGEWISVKDRLPESSGGQWSADVIALCDNGEVFRLACQGDYWQRSAAFIESGADRVTHWMPLTYPAD
ncbi:MAG: DUF551 domain-containing protein [Stenotrophomonas sp.]|jgi:hypothetical protein|uniref:DUF551 domain-containing protein n=1 Tax=Stenotrophomonas sp. TaxID=69392 RepID=UPI001355484A|nr:DUF551 domain-containing protein [Stenotrophomonas sp.]MTI72574.1 DUF551 domain-containing protein [Stenotrophomonas sp.]MTI72634.1 DUF551 domain-containing protein [Stenotrophomonas sp.]